MTNNKEKLCIFLILNFLTPLYGMKEPLRKKRKITRSRMKPVKRKPLHLPEDIWYSISSFLTLRENAHLRRVCVSSKEAINPPLQLSDSSKKLKEHILAQNKNDFNFPIEIYIKYIHKNSLNELIQTCNKQGISPRITKLHFGPTPLHGVPSELLAINPKTNRPFFENLDKIALKNQPKGWQEIPTSNPILPFLGTLSQLKEISLNCHSALQAHNLLSRKDNQTGKPLFNKLKTLTLSNLSHFWPLTNFVQTLKTLPNLKKLNLKKNHWGKESKQYFAHEFKHLELII